MKKIIPYLFIGGMFQSVFAKTIEIGETNKESIQYAVYTTENTNIEENDTLNGDFENNEITSNSSIQNPTVLGGAVFYEKENVSIIGNYTNNSIISTSYTNTEGSGVANASGAGIAVYSGTVTSIAGDFKNNSASAISNATEGVTSIKANALANGGAIFNQASIGTITGDFEGNSVSAIGDTNTGIPVNGGGAIANYTSTSTIESIEGNFTNNSVSGNQHNMYGGAILNKGTLTLTASEDDITNTGNSVTYNGELTDEKGGFLFTGTGSITNFDIGDGLKMTIGDGRVGYDSIASEDNTAVINKDGLGTLTVNSSMQYYTGTLNVNAGTMNVNNGFGGKLIVSSAVANLSNVNYVGDSSQEQLTSFSSIMTLSGDGSILTLSDSSVENKNVKYEGSSYFDGYALRVNSKNFANLSNFNFAGNKITSNSVRGGAIFAQANSNLTIEGSNFSNNTLTSFVDDDSATQAKMLGGFMYERGANVDIKSTTFENNTLTSSDMAQGGVIYSIHEVENETSLSIKDSVFSNNQVISLGLNEDYSKNSVYGGAISLATERSGMLIEDTLFVNNAAINKSSNGEETYGGAILLQGGNQTSQADLTIKVTNNMSYLGNFVQIGDSNRDDKGGFLYINAKAGDLDTIFDIGDKATLTIGDGRAGYDSIASNIEYADNTTLVKTGAGTMTVNSSMQYFYGALNVQEGLMEVNNILGASSIKIDSGATLSLTISADNTLINSSLSIANAGTLKLVAGIDTSAGAKYSISTADLDFDSDGGLGAIAYGGAVSGNTFTVGSIKNISSDNISSTTVSGGSTIKITDAVTNSVVSISTSSESSLTVSSARDLGETLTSIDDKEVLSAWSFTIAGVDETDGVVLSFLVSDVEDVTLLQLLHREDSNSDWEIITGGSYDADSDLYSVVVNDFCDYALVAVPEPSTYAMIFGALALGLAVYRRRK